ncbi:SET domain [Phytophthora cactorum]|nr:SET domain [Phytophthora cactorum]
MMPRRHRRQSTMDRVLVGGEAAASYRVIDGVLGLYKSNVYVGVALQEVTAATSRCKMAASFAVIFAALEELKSATNYYGMAVTNNEVIGARAIGGLARFANHSCQPNCVIERWDVNAQEKMSVQGTGLPWTDPDVGKHLTFERIQDLPIMHC